MATLGTNLDMNGGTIINCPNTIPLLGTNVIPKSTGSGGLGNSSLTDDGNKVTSAKYLHVYQNLGSGPQPVLMFQGSNGGRVIKYDQWTVSNDFYPGLGLFQFSLTRGEAHKVTVSGTSMTTAQTFCDLLLITINSSGVASAVNVYATSSVGSPPARVYSMNNGGLWLDMTGNFTVYNVVCIDEYST